MMTVGVTGLVLGVLFAAVGLSTGIYTTAFLVAAGCFGYELYQRSKDKGE